MNPVIMRIVVDFPAPFGPRKPSTSPRSTVNEMPSTTRLGPNAFASLSIFIMLKEGQNYRRITRLQSADVWRLGPERLEIRSRFTRADRGSDARCIAGSDRSAIPDQTRKDYRALRTGRRLRFHRPLHGTAPYCSARVAGHRGEPAGRRRTPRHRVGSESGPRRLHVDADQFKLHRQPCALSHQIRSAERYHPGHSGVPGSDARGGQSEAAGKDHEGADRACEVEARP